MFLFVFILSILKKYYSFNEFCIIVTFFQSRPMQGAPYKHMRSIPLKMLIYPCKYRSQVRTSISKQALQELKEIKRLWKLGRSLLIKIFALRSIIICLVCILVA